MKCYFSSRAPAALPSLLFIQENVERKVYVFLTAYAASSVLDVSKIEVLVTYTGKYYEA